METPQSIHLRRRVINRMRAHNKRIDIVKVSAYFDGLEYLRLIARLPIDFDLDRPEAWPTIFQAIKTLSVEHLQELKKKLTLQAS